MTCLDNDSDARVVFLELGNILGDEVVELDREAGFEEGGRGKMWGIDWMSRDWCIFSAMVTIQTSKKMCQDNAC